MALQRPPPDEQPRPTRRDLLASGVTIGATTIGAATIAAVAGCTALEDRSDDGPDHDPAVDDDRFPDEEDIFTDLEVRTFRYATTDSVIERDEEHYSRRVGRQYVIDREDIEALSFVGEPIDGGDPIEFLERIDYDEATGIVLSRGVNACERQRLTYVERRSGGGFRVRFCRTYRDPDVACSTDDRHTQVTLIEVPESVDRRPSGFGRGGSSSCQLPPGHPANDGSERE